MDKDRTSDGRRPGDLVFAWAFLAVAVLLLAQLGRETAAPEGGSFAAQPRFWPGLSLAGMCGFAALHLLSTALGGRRPGHRGEVLTWLRALEFAGWFIGYAVAVPRIGYLPATLVLVLALLLRLGQRSVRMLGWGAVVAVTVVVLFRSGLRVRLPAGAVYEHLPDGLRQVMMVHF